MRCVLVSCCGLPAAGKTTFCRSVVAEASSTASSAPPVADHRSREDPVITGGPRVRVSHVCFDEHIARARLQCEPCSSDDDNKPAPNSVRPLRGVHPVAKVPQERRGVGEEESEIGDSRGDDRDSSGARDARNGLRTAPTVSRNGETAAVVSTTYGVGVGGRGVSSTCCAIETPRVTESARTPQESGDLKGGEHGARWWHEGRRAAVAEVEALATTPQGRGASPATTSSGSEHQIRAGEALFSVTSPPATTSTASVTEAEAGERKIDMEEIVTHPEGDSFAPEEGSSCTGASSGIHVVLADDNMHFRSMRHEVWRLARKLGCGYAQVFFPTDVDVAVGRNKMRGTPVTEAVIRKMAASIQPPDPERFKWERHTTVVQPLECPFPQRHSAHLKNSHGKDSGQVPEQCNRMSCGTGHSLDANDGPTEKASGANPRLLFWSAIVAAAAEDPIPLSSPASSDASLVGKADRVATRASLLHQFDLELREAVKRVAKAAASAGLTRHIHQQVMGACAASRKIALRDSRSGGTTISKGRDGSVRGSVQDDVNCPPCSCPPHIERFTSEFEKTLSIVKGLDRPLMVELVAVARRSASRTALHLV